MKNRPRKWLLSMLMLCLALLFTASLTMAADPKDVPTDHWAYKAVKMLVEKGYLQLYQDQTFQGNQPVDRFTLAAVVAKILTEVAAGGVGTNQEDVKLLRNLTNELRQELVKIISNTTTYSKKTDEMKRNDVVLKEDLIRTNLLVQTLNAEQIELQKEVKQLIADLESLQHKVDGQAIEIVLLKEEVNQLKNEVVQLKSEDLRLKEENRKQKWYLILAVVLGLFGAAK